MLLLMMMMVLYSDSLILTKKTTNNNTQKWRVSNSLDFTMKKTKKHEKRFLIRSNRSCHNRVMFLILFLISTSHRQWKNFYEMSFIDQPNALLQHFDVNYNFLCVSLNLNKSRTVWGDREPSLCHFRMVFRSFWSFTIDSIKILI